MVANWGLIGLKLSSLKVRMITRPVSHWLKDTLASLSFGYGFLRDHCAPRSQSTEPDERVEPLVVMLGAAVQEKLVGMFAVPCPITTNAASELDWMLCVSATVTAWPLPAAPATRSA
jgi:hypothetical protein